MSGVIVMAMPPQINGVVRGSVRIYTPRCPRASRAAMLARVTRCIASALGAHGVTRKRNLSKRRGRAYADKHDAF